MSIFLCLLAIVGRIRCGRHVFTDEVYKAWALFSIADAMIALCVIAALK